jgi:hypothetical protein
VRLPVSSGRCPGGQQAGHLPDQVHDDPAQVADPVNLRHADACPRGGGGSGAAATMALARSRPDWCRHGLRGLLSGEPLRTVTTAPSRGAKYPPFGAVWSSCDLSAKAAQMRSYWCATESGEYAPGRKVVRPVTSWGSGWRRDRAGGRGIQGRLGGRP